MSEIITDFEKIGELNAELSLLDKKIEEKTFLWMELGEKI